MLPPPPILFYRNPVVYTNYPPRRELELELPPPRLLLEELREELELELEPLLRLLLLGLLDEVLGLLDELLRLGLALLEGRLDELLGL
jgi:hypothetical protein